MVNSVECVYQWEIWGERANMLLRIPYKLLKQNMTVRLGTIIHRYIPNWVIQQSGGNIN